MNPTTDPKLRSFIEIPSNHEFPIQNLPYGVFSTPDRPEPRAGVRIGDLVLDLAVIERMGLLRKTALGDAHVFQSGSLNAFMARGRDIWRSVRARISDLLSHDNTTLLADAALRTAALIPVERVQLRLPVQIGDYTDFYSSKHHAFNVGSMFRDPKNALLPNYLWIPVGYHGRASSVVASGTPVRRPCGQTKSDEAAAPVFGPCRLLDFELEVGFFTGGAETKLGETISIDEAEQRIFGLTLVNDWSARDIQKWEYVPLGPFLAKNFATTISPWIVPLEALEPFRCAGPEQTPPPLEYLKPSERDDAAGSTFDIHLEVGLQTPSQELPHVVCRSNFRHLYWSMAQQLTHHAVTGCNIRPGDLMASGTISGPTPESYGSMLELAWKGTKPIDLPGGEQRKFIQDGDTVVMRGWCEGDGYRIGFGECTGKVLPAKI